MQGRIIQIRADIFKVASGNVIKDAKASKLFKLNKIDLKVGDEVIFQEYMDGLWYIEKRLERRNDLVRPAVSNIDQAIVCISVKEPAFNQNLLDRFLTILAFNNIDATILLTKWDLLTLAEQTKMEEITHYYQAIGYECFQTTIKNATFRRTLEKLIAGKMCVITGQSGVGKSSLINILDESLKLETAEISTKLNRGKHTTRYTTIYQIGSGYLIDTPGFGNLDFTGLDEASLSHSFFEIFQASASCKYKGCLHDTEPGCHVKELVAQNIINKERYENYLSFLKIIKQTRKY